MPLTRLSDLLISFDFVFSVSFLMIHIVPTPTVQRREIGASLASLRHRAPVVGTEKNVTWPVPFHPSKEHPLCCFFLESIYSFERCLVLAGCCIWFWTLAIKQASALPESRQDDDDL